MDFFYDVASVGLADVVSFLSVGLLCVVFLLVSFAFALSACLVRQEKTSVHTTVSLLRSRKRLLRPSSPDEQGKSERDSEMGGARCECVRPMPAEMWEGEAATTCEKMR